MKPLARISLLGSMVVLMVATAILFSNPFNWFVQRSEYFSRENFEMAQPGMSKEKLVELLGRPLRVTEIRTPFSRCEGCSVHYFMGDPPEWLIAFEEAWVYVSPDGMVKEKIWNVEP